MKWEILSIRISKFLQEVWVGMEANRRPVMNADIKPRVLSNLWKCSIKAKAPRSIEKKRKT